MCEFWPTVGAACGLDTLYANVALASARSAIFELHSYVQRAAGAQLLTQTHCRNTTQQTGLAAVSVPVVVTACACVNVRHKHSN